MTPSTALWHDAKYKLSLRTELLCPVTDSNLLLECLWSGVSKGTERLVFEGLIPKTEWERMRCPFQHGTFNYPVKYGYGFVGRIMDTDRSDCGKNVFCLHPHQTHAIVPQDAVHILPDDLPPRRAILAANMETALNVTWDAGISAGDRVLIVGAGVVGLLIATLAAATPGTEVTICDIDAGKHKVAASLGLTACAPDAAPGDCDVTINASASPQGLELALECAGFEARVVEASWFGDRDVSVPLGRAFHSKRLQIVSSQVGHVSPTKRARWTYARRMAKAISFLSNPALDNLITNEVDFLTAPDQLPPLFGNPAALGIALRYAPTQQP